MKVKDILAQKGSHVWTTKANATIHKALGGTFTVITEQGFMASIAGKDADAISCMN